MTTQPPEPTNQAADDKRRHTKDTDKILKVIDQQPLNRYEVALRLTRWVAADRAQAVRAALESVLANGHGGGNWRRLLLEAIEKGKLEQ